jgi:hypothetical protein
MSSPSCLDGEQAMYTDTPGESMSITCISRVLAVVPESLASETLGSKVGCLLCLSYAFQLHVTTQTPGLVLDLAFTQFLDHALK